MITPSLPRSYKIKEARQKLTSVLELKKFPGPYNGSYRSIKETVVAAILSEVTMLNINTAYLVIFCI